MDKNEKLIIILAVLAIFVIAGCSTNGNVVHIKQDAKESIKIGVFAPLTGDAAIYGDSLKKGSDLAMEDINSEGGVLGRQVKLVYEDTHLDAKLTVSTMSKFVNVDKLDFVISAEGSGATLAAAPLADETKTLMMVAIASTPSIKEAGDYVFRVVPSDDYQAVEMARLSEEREYKNAAILYVNDEYGIGITKILDEKLNLVAKESFESGVTDFKTQLTKIKSKNTDVLIIVARKEFPTILKQTKEIGIESQIIASVELKDETIINTSGDNAENVLIPFFAETTDYVKYENKFKAKYDVEPALFSNYGYDALKVLSIAIENAGTTDSEKVKDELYRTTYYGATGIIKFDENGEVNEKPFVVYQVRNGQLAEVS